MYLCRRLSGARQSEIGALIALAGKIIADDLAALGNLRSGALIALAGKIIAEDLAALGNLRSGLSLRRRQIIAADTRRVEKSMGKAWSGASLRQGQGANNHRRQS